MQEEVTRGAVTLIVDGAKLSEQVFEKAVKKFLEEIQKSQKPKIYRGRQSLKQLASQNAGLANIEISDKNITPPIIKFNANRAIPPPREPPPGTIQRHIRWRPNGSPQSIQSHT